MSKRVEEAAKVFHNQALSDAQEYSRMHGGSLIEEVSYGRGLKAGFIKGYGQAEKDTIERAVNVLINLPSLVIPSNYIAYFRKQMMEEE